MKKLLLCIGLAAVSTLDAFAGETLSLKLVPDHGMVFKNTPQEVVVKIELSAVVERNKPHRTALNLAVVLDKSGSMTGAKLEKTKQAAMQLVDRLRPEDVFSLVIFSDKAEVLVPAQKVTDKDDLKDKIEAIQADGSTALYAGVKLGADQLREYFSGKRINRVILLSDGIANVGPSSPRQLRRLGSDLAERGISVTTIGVGDDYNEDVMAAIAEASDANYYYVSDTEKLPEIFAKELGGMLEVAARDLRIEVICPDGVKPLGFIGREEKFDGQRCVVNLSQVAGGQDRYILLRCLVNGQDDEVAHVNVSYKDELDNGSAQTASGTARIMYTDKQSDFEKSVNGEVMAQKELMLTAVAKDEALARADAGDYKQAALILNTQNAALNQAYTAAPAAVQSQIRAESNNVTVFYRQLDGGEYGSGSRKAMQSQSWEFRNSK